MARQQQILFLMLLSIFEKTCSNREHRVHNLILYPDKHEWCEAREIEMVITHPSCTPETFSNRVCVGQCFSYSSPRTRPANRVEDKLKYCDYCKPSNSTWETIVLQCDTDRYTIFAQEVELIHECECDSCYPEQYVREYTPPEDNYVYEYAHAYGDYEEVERNEPDISAIIQEQLQSENVEELDRESERFIEFNINQETLDQASRVRAEQRELHHNNRNSHGPDRVMYNSRDPSNRQWILDEEEDEQES